MNAEDYFREARELRKLALVPGTDTMQLAADADDAERHGYELMRARDLTKRSQYVRLGKFDNARDEFLYDMTLNGWANESSGDSESPTRWFALVIIERAELAEVWAALDDSRRAMVSARESAGDLVGSFIVSTDSQGFVYVESFDTADLARAEYAARDAEYGEWIGEEDDA
jgi:hypothetical protein